MLVDCSSSAWDVYKTVIQGIYRERVVRQTLRMIFLILIISLALSLISGAPQKFLTDCDARYQDGVITEGLQSFKVICHDCFRSYGEVAFIRISENSYMTSTKNPNIKMKTEATVYLDPCQDHRLIVKANLRSGEETVKMLYYKKEACPKGSSNSSCVSWIFSIIAFLLTIVL